MDIAPLTLRYAAATFRPLEQRTDPAANTDIFAVVAATPAGQSLHRRLEEGGVLTFDSVHPAAQPFFTALLRRQFPHRPIVVVTEGLKTQESFEQDLKTWLRHSSSGTVRAPLFYPAWETLPHEAKLPHADVISERLETLVALVHLGSPAAPAPVVITAVPALLQRTFPPDELKSRLRRLERGDRLDPLDLVEWLEDQGYEPEAKVTQKGELSLRGGILDVWSPTGPWPMRLEFFGDQIESLRSFDPASQISREEAASTVLTPAGEIGILKQAVAAGGSVTLATLLDYLPRKTLFVFAEPETLDTQAAAYEQQVPDHDPFFVPWRTFGQELEQRGLTLLRLSEAAEGDTAPSASLPDLDESGALPEAEVEATPHPPALPAPRFESLDAFRPLGPRAPEPQIAEAQRREFFAQLHRWLRQGHSVHVICNNDGERQRFEEVWSELGFGNVGPSFPVPSENASRARKDEQDAGPTLHLGALSRGFLCDAARLVVVTDAEIFGRYKVQRPRRLKSPHAQSARSLLDIDFTDLQEGDFVVHLQHGIGRYVGLQTLAASAREAASPPQPSGAGQECLVIEYAPSQPDQPPPRLYVPVTEAHLVSKYVGAGKARPQLNTLGGTRWKKARAQAEHAVRDLAGGLLAIQAARASQPGHACAADTPWQREFESAFLYEETPDQVRAIAATKADQEAPRPMDRLICGDVGFGKTEVAIRAAFKAVLGGQQVALLVPTTVLAQQHFNTFRERMADYPVRIELLSRFRTRREQERVVRDLAGGTVDIVIGTHRLLQGDIRFKDLGLVVIDEEQRFGVLHKEKFKQLRQLVDVLTLSATPIPRTLYLALTGARDMSTIETPPQDRLPVETLVAQYDERLIRDAIQRELNRGGQVFFLHNRVNTIDAMAVRLAALVPHARIVVGHGQMASDELEEVMTRFMNGDADVLLSTTIIESGLDIPNANTIIIDRADRFGLSDLYQLRGRVGRYKHQAFAYLLIPRHAGLLSDARKRISAIKQYSTLGSGFKIAMRDLEIRGAGNLLGPEQSGHITAVGFELYCQLLQQSIAALKGEKVKPRIDVTVRLDFLALSPGDDTAAPTPKPDRSKRRRPAAVSVPREVAVYASDADEVRTAAAEDAVVPRTGAYIPLHYIPEAQQRVDVYRKLAQVTDQAALERVRKEVRDRFGPAPPAVELLLEVTGLKLLAAARGISVLETRGDKLMLTRNNDYLMPGGRFPRLAKKDARGRLNEIRKLLLAL